MSDLNKKFEEVQSVALKDIHEQLDIARKAIAKAEQISEETGIPFYSDVSPLSQGYKPSSCYDKWKDMDDMNSYLEWSAEQGEEGWQHSAVCW